MEVLLHHDAVGHDVYLLSDVHAEAHVGGRVVVHVPGRDDVEGDEEGDVEGDVEGATYDGILMVLALVRISSS